MKQKLNKLVTKQNTSAERVFSLIEESKEISREEREINETNILESLIRLVMNAADDDFTIIGSELDRLCIGLHMMEGIHIFHEDRFRKELLKTGGAVRDVLRVVKNLLDPCISEEEEIFKTKYFRLPRSLRVLDEGCV